MAYSSKKLTQLFNKYWDQDNLTFEIHVEDEITVMINDELVKGPQPLSRRSQGLRAAISLFINIMSLPEHTIVLLDDPGVHLHASGQKDILKMMEEVSKTKQIIFSTHSPFMIDKNNLDRVKIVTKDPKWGTTIKEKFHISDYDALEPIRTSIGMKLADSLFITNKNLLVEGRSDWLIIEALSKFNSDTGTECIDTSKISIFPTVGASKMPIYTTLLTKDGFEFVALLDYDKEGKRIAEQLKDKFSVDENLIITLDMIFEDDSEENVVIEDLIDLDLYIEAMNSAYKDIFQEKIGRGSINKEELVQKNLDGIIKFFETKNLGKLDKIMVARKIYELILEKKSNPNSDTVSNFSTLFKMINKKLE